MTRSEWLNLFLDQWPAKVVSLGAAMLLFFFTSLVDLRSNYVTIPIRYIMPAGMVAAEEPIARARLQIRGNASAIEGISENDIQVSADFSSIQSPGTFQTPLRVKTLGSLSNFDELEIEVEPASLRIALENIAFKELPVKVRFEGEPKSGYELQEYRIQPQVLRVSGPESKVMALEYLETEVVALGARSNGFSQQVRVRAPSSLVTVSGGALVELQVNVQEKRVPLAIGGIIPEVRNLGQGLSVGEIGPIAVRINLSYTQSQGTDPPALSAWIDCAGIAEPGTYLLPVLVQAPEGGVVESIDPLEVSLEVFKGRNPAVQERAGRDSPRETGLQ